MSDADCYTMSVFCCCLTNNVHDIWYVNKNDVALWNIVLMRSDSRYCVVRSVD